jgi:hypothetical protein
MAGEAMAAETSDIWGHRYAVLRRGAGKPRGSGRSLHVAPSPEEESPAEEAEAEPRAFGEFFLAEGICGVGRERPDADAGRRPVSGDVFTE